MATELKDGSLTLSQELTARADCWEDLEASVDSRASLSLHFCLWGKALEQRAASGAWHSANPKPLTRQALASKDP